MHAVKKTAVVFRLRYQEGQQESVHRVPELRCPWCDMTCGKLESIMFHLQASHDRFSYTLDKSLAIPEIYINVKASSSTEELNKSLAPHADFSFLSARCGGGPLSASLSQLLACEDDAGKHDIGADGANKKHKKGNDIVSSSINSKGKQAALQTKPCAKQKVKGKKGARVAVEKKSLAQRQLFRSQTCLPIDVNDQMDMDYDSDDDVDDEWQLAQVSLPHLTPHTHSFSRPLSLRVSKIPRLSKDSWSRRRVFETPPFCCFRPTGYQFLVSCKEILG